MKKNAFFVMFFVIIGLFLIALLALITILLEIDINTKENENNSNMGSNLVFNEVTKYDIPVDNKTLNSYKTTHLEVDENMMVDLILNFSMLNSNMVLNNIIETDAYAKGEKISYSDDYVIISCNPKENDSSIFFSPDLIITHVNGVEQYRNGDDGIVLGVLANNFLDVFENEINERTYKYRFTGEYNAEYRIDAVCITSKTSCKRVSKPHVNPIIVKIKNSIRGDLPEVYYN